MKTKYRIVIDNYRGYEVQVKRWYPPLWIQNKINTHSTIASAKGYIEYLKNLNKNLGKVVYEE